MRFYFLSILLILFIIASGVFVYYFVFLKRRYSRERFAFIGLASVSSFLITAMFALLARGWIEEILFALLNAVGLEVQLFQKDELLLNVGFTLGAAILLAYLVLGLHRNWNGPISQREANEEELGRSTNIFNNAHFYWNMRGK